MICINLEEFQMNKAFIRLAVTALLLLLAFGLFAKQLSVVDGVDIKPNPMDRRCEIFIRLNGSANLGVNIEDDRGNVIKTLYWGPAQKELVLAWDRLSDNGEYVPSGKYVLVLNYDARYTSLKKTLILK